MFNKKTLLGSGAVFFFLLFVLLTFMMVKQHGFFLQLARTHHFHNDIVNDKKQMEQNIAVITNGLHNLSVQTQISEIFAAKSIMLEEFSGMFDNNLISINVADEKGVILFTSANKRMVGNHISPHILSWLTHSVKEPFLFLSDENTLIGIIKYDVPYSLTEIGYIIIELPSSVLFKASSIMQHFIRIIENDTPIILVSNKEGYLDSTLASQLAVRFRMTNQSSMPEELGCIFEVKNLGKLIYYIGSQSYFPPMMIFLTLLMLILTQIFLFLYFCSPRHLVPKFEEETSWNNINQLIEDITSGTHYDKETADSMMSQASEFGFISETPDNNNNSKVENILITPDLDQDISPKKNEDDFNISFDTESVDFDLSDPQIQPNDLSPDTLDDLDILDDVLELFDDDNEIDDNNSPLKSDVDVSTDSIDSLINKIQTHLQPLLIEYKISYYAISEPADGLFIFNQTSNFSQQFIIDQKDSLYNEVLSQHQVLSLSGNLSQSSYLEDLLSIDIINTINELFIIPIIKNNNVTAIIVLARDKELPVLSNTDKQKIFTIGAKI